LLDLFHEGAERLGHAPAEDCDQQRKSDERHQQRQSG
jgi:hypothetical protein